MAAVAARGQDGLQLDCNAEKLLTYAWVSAILSTGWTNKSASFFFAVLNGRGSTSALAVKIQLLQSPLAVRVLRFFVVPRHPLGCGMELHSGERRAPLSLWPRPRRWR